MLFFSSAPNIFHIQLKKKKDNPLSICLAFLLPWSENGISFLIWLFSSKTFTTDLLNCIFLYCLSLRHGPVNLCCYKKDTMDWVAHKQQKFNFQNSRGWLRLLRSRHQHIQCLWGCFLPHRSLSSLVPAHVAEREGRRSSVSFIMALIPFRRALPSWPKILL